jgi:hypothetical protein
MQAVEARRGDLATFAAAVYRREGVMDGADEAQTATTPKDVK